MADKKISQLPAATIPLAGTEVLPIVQSGTTDKVSVANLTAGRAVSAASLTLTSSPLPIASGGTNQSAFTSPASSIAGLVWFDGTSFQNDSTTSHVGYNASTNVFYANTPTFSGNTTLSTGNLVIGTSGKGIDFSATANSPYGTMTSEIFYDYEEGTWTPVLYINASSTGITGTFAGTYTKVGRTVTCFGSISLTSKGASVGNAWIGGLPYVSDVAGGGLDFVYTSPTSSISTPFTYRIDATTSFAIITGSTNSNITDTTVWAFKIVYQAA